MCAQMMRDGRQLGDLVRTDLVVRVVDRWEFNVPAVAAVTAAIGNDVAGEPQCVFTCWGEEMARTTTVDADDLFCRRTRERIGEIGVRHGHSKCGRLVWVGVARFVTYIWCRRRWRHAQ